MAAVKHPRKSLPAIFPEPFCLLFHSSRSRCKEYLPFHLIYVPLASMSRTNTVWQSKNSSALQREDLWLLIPEAWGHHGKQPARSPAHCSWESHARKHQSEATETIVRREHNWGVASPLFSANVPFQAPWFCLSDHITETFSTYGCKYPARSHLHLICSSYIFQWLAHRLMGLDQRKLLEIIMQIDSSVNVHWTTLKITPTIAAKTPWTLANDMQPCSHFSSECTHFELDKLKWDKNLALGWQGKTEIASVRGRTEGKTASHSEHSQWFSLPRNMHLLISELQRSWCKEFITSQRVLQLRFIGDARTDQQTQDRK